MRTVKLNTGVKVTELKRNTIRGLRHRIEVSSDDYNEDSMFHDITSETAYKNQITNQLHKIFRL